VTLTAVSEEPRSNEPRQVDPLTLGAATTADGNESASSGAGSDTGSAGDERPSSNVRVPVVSGAAPDDSAAFTPVAEATAASGPRASASETESAIEPAPRERSTLSEAPRPSTPAVDAGAQPARESSAPLTARLTPTPTGDADQPRSLQQATEKTMLASVQRGLGAALAQRGGEMTIRLAPQALGAVRISMTVAQGVVTANFTPETAEAARLLRGGLDSLRESIESRGLQVDRIRVATAPAQAASDANDARSDNNAARRDDSRSDAGDGRSRGGGDHPGSRGQREGGENPETRFKQQWRLALDATA